MLAFQLCLLNWRMIFFFFFLISANFPSCVTLNRQRCQIHSWNEINYKVKSQNLSKFCFREDQERLYDVDIIIYLDERIPKTVLHLCKMWTILILKCVLKHVLKNIKEHIIIGKVSVIIHVLLLISDILKLTASASLTSSLLLLQEMQFGLKIWTKQNMKQNKNTTEQIEE